MANAKQEFLNTVANYKVMCCSISFQSGWYTSTTYSLAPGYTQEMWEEFIDALDFEYDSGYGMQMLFGTIWCENGVWMSRGEYDGSEWWEINKYPKIPTLWPKDIITKVTEEDYYNSDAEFSEN